MDPEATLDAAEQALDDGDLETAIDRFEDYHQWRKRGGFAPTGGDARAKRLETKLLRAHGKGLTGRRRKRRGLGVSFFEETPDDTAFRHAEDARWNARQRYAESIGMMQTAKLSASQRQAWVKQAQADRTKWDAAERRYREAAKAVGVGYHRLPEYAVNPRTGRQYDPTNKGSKRGFVGLGSTCADAKREAERALRAAKTPAQRRAAEKFAARVSERCAVDLRGMSRRRKRRR